MYAIFQREFTYSDHPILYNIQNNVIGHDLVIKGPYGERPGKWRFFNYRIHRDKRTIVCFLVNLLSGNFENLLLHKYHKYHKPS